jgi:quaternary ammonium compound-resistance protein SugE
MAGMSGWYYLLLGGLLEIVWAISTKACPWWTLYISIGAGAGSVSCLYAALETMPIGTAYAVWTGIGAAGSALVGIGLFGESTSALRLGSLALVTVGLVGIGLSSQ